MLSTAIPYKFAQPWAASATAGYSTAPIPLVAVGGNAGQDQGFPPQTAAPPAAGGTPPNIADFNGLGLYFTSWVQWLAAGAPIAYDPTFSTNIGGYPAGAILATGADATQQWTSTTNNNATDPDTGGAGWFLSTQGKLLGPPIMVTASTTLAIGGGAGNLPLGTRRAIAVLVAGGGVGGTAGATIASEGSVGSGGTSGARAAAGAAFIAANPSQCPFALGSYYNASEFDEGGGSINLTIGDPTGARMAAFAASLK